MQSEPTESTGSLLRKFLTETIFPEAKPLTSILRRTHQVFRLNRSLIYEERYLDSPLYADVYLRSQTGRIFPAHRFVLSAACPFFYDLLLRHPKQGINEVIHLAWTDKELETLLRFFYTGEAHNCTPELGAVLVEIINPRQQVLRTPSPHCCQNSSALTSADLTALANWSENILPLEGTSNQIVAQWNPSKLPSQDMLHRESGT